jgi:quinoprotein dehydrogenase-associated probable ABC transporter substrate-binding protein
MLRQRSSRWCAAGIGCVLLAMALARPAAADVLRVCADPANLPQSNAQGEGYENKIAEALAHDLNREPQYTYFPQRMGFVRNTLRARDEVTQQYKCDLIIGVPRGYELTATTRPYLHSTYALVFAPHGPLSGVHSIADVLALPPEVRARLRVGVFARTPASDWVLHNGMMDRAVFYAPQSGDPNETPGGIAERDLAAGNVDAAVLWGPMAGYLVGRHATPAPGWVALPFPADTNIRFDYEISMGVRNGEQSWLDTLNAWIEAHQGQIDRILDDYRVPRLALTSAPGAAGE